MKKVAVIGSGFAGMSAASFMAKAGWEVTVFEKHQIPGGRARQLKAEGFVFDMGPSWYWMPDIFERYFSSFGKKVSDYYQLTRLDPSYRVVWKDSSELIPAGMEELIAMFNRLENEGGVKLKAFLQQAAYKYDVGINKLVYKPGLSATEFIDKEVIAGVFRMDIFQSMQKHIRKYFKHPKLIQLLEFPILFLGALPADIPALYSLMNYADMKLGTWYPSGGMYSVVKAMHELACETGVGFNFNSDVVNIEVEKGKATGINYIQNGVPGFYAADVIIGAADYHHVETNLLPEKYRSYTEGYWEKRVMAPSSLLYYVGINKKLKRVLHHTLFFDVDFNRHGEQIYSEVGWPDEPLFYACASSVTDSSSAPEGCENLFFLIPVAAGLSGDTEILREDYFKKIIRRFEADCGEEVMEHITYYKSYSVSDFKHDYNAFKGNAYGLANTLMQTAIFKPSIRSKKISNLFYTGQLTVPGPGVPPSIISGEVVSNQILKEYKGIKQNL